MQGWLGGLHVHRMERGQVPVADLLCTACWQHRRATGHRPNHNTYRAAQAAVATRKDNTR